MSKVVALKPHITEVAHNIAMKFAKADNVRARAHSIRVEIGFDLLDLQQRIASGEGRADGRPEEFWVWIKLYVDRSLRDMRKCIALAKAEDPEAAAAQEREDTRQQTQRYRARKAERSHSETPAQVVNIDPVERVVDGFRVLIQGLTEGERKRLLARLWEEFPWLNVGQQRSN